MFKCHSLQSQLSVLQASTDSGSSVKALEINEVLTSFITLHQKKVPSMSRVFLLAGYIILTYEGKFALANTFVGSVISLMPELARRID